jgi:hypothetical protein
MNVTFPHGHMETNAALAQQKQNKYSRYGPKRCKGGIAAPMKKAARRRLLIVPGAYCPRFARAFAAMRMRSAFSLMKPPASAWL